MLNDVNWEDKKPPAIKLSWRHKGLADKSLADKKSCRQKSCCQKCLADKQSVNNRTVWLTDCGMILHPIPCDLFTSLWQEMTFEGRFM